MKRWLLACCSVLHGALRAGTHPGSRLSASAGSKVAVAMPDPQSSGVDAGLVDRELKGVVLADLEDAGPVCRRQEVLARLGGGFLLSSLGGGRHGLAAGLPRDLHFHLGRGGRPAGRGREVGQGRVQQEILGKDGRLAQDGAHHLRRSGGQAHRARGVATSRIVFVRQLAPGVKDLFQVDRDGANLLQLTDHKSLTLSPTVAPDGRIAYVTYKGGAPEIWGQLKSGGPHVKIYPRSGSPEGHCFAPRWSPDGKRMALVQGDRRGNSDIVVLDLETGRVRRLTDSNCINTEPSWNPAGTQIAFTRTAKARPRSTSWRMTVQRPQAHPRGNYNASPAWSPGGSMIAYVSASKQVRPLRLQARRRKSYQVTTGVASSESPAWSPDERRIVFSSGSRGGMQIYTTDLSGNTLRKLTGFAGCQSPTWTRTR